MHANYYMLPAPTGSDNFRHSGISTPTRMISNDVPKSDVWASVLRRLTTCSIRTPMQPWLWTPWDAGSALLVEVHLDFDRVDLPHARMIDLGAVVGRRWLSASPPPLFLCSILAYSFHFLSSTFSVFALALRCPSLLSLAHSFHLSLASYLYYRCPSLLCPRYICLFSFLLLTILLFSASFFLGVSSPLKFNSPPHPCLFVFLFLVSVSLLLLSNFRVGTRTMAGRPYMSSFKGLLFENTSPKELEYPGKTEMFSFGSGDWLEAGEAKDVMTDTCGRWFHFTITPQSNAILEATNLPQILQNTDFVQKKTVVTVEFMLNSLRAAGILDVEGLASHSDVVLSSCLFAFAIAGPSAPLHCTAYCH